MAPSSRQIVRRAVGVAAVAPGIALFVLAGVLFWQGGAGNILAGFVVAAIGIGLMLVALMMTHAPVTIAKLLRRTDERRQAREQEQAKAGPNGHDDARGVSSTGEDDAP